MTSNLILLISKLILLNLDILIFDTRLSQVLLYADKNLPNYFNMNMPELTLQFMQETGRLH